MNSYTLVPKETVLLVISASKSYLSGLQTVYAGT